MTIGVLKETYPGERRVALVPAAVGKLAKAGQQVLLECGAGLAAGFPDDQYAEKGVEIVSREEAIAADILFQVRCFGANQQAGKEDLGKFRQGQVVVGMCDPLGAAEAAREVAQTGVSQFALELIPRITRAQSMDVLSSMANLAGYRAVLLSTMHLAKIFPLMMTAAGTIRPSGVFVIGAGVAGLQAIATAKRLGAVVSGYDVRPAVREQVESLGGKFVEMELETGAAEDKGGYAKAMGEEFYNKQREFMAEVVAQNDVVITTAAIPGKPSPLLITADAVKGMRQGSVIVDLAAERGGNCELTEADQTIEQHGVTILGPTNLPSEVAYHASQMYANNCVNFLLNMIKDGELRIDQSDEIVRDTLIAKDGEVVSNRLREMLGMPAVDPPTATAAGTDPTEGDGDSEATADASAAASEGEGETKGTEG